MASASRRIASTNSTGASFGSKTNRGYCWRSRTFVIHCRLAATLARRAIFLLCFFNVATMMHLLMGEQRNSTLVNATRCHENEKRLRHNSALAHSLARQTSLIVSYYFYSY